MSITARDIIVQALRKIGVGSLGEVLAADEMNACLDALNVLLKSWSGRRLLTTAAIQESFALVGGTAAYTIGASVIAPNFITQKPIRILDGCFIRDQNGSDYPLNVISRELYNSYDTKTNRGLPTELFYDAGATQQALQTGTITFYLTPDTTNTYTVFLVSEKPFTVFASLNAAYTFPDIYERAMIYNLALEVAPEYGKTVHREVISSANESLDIIIAINSSNKRTVSDLGLPGSSRRTANILNGP
jgi:hypothetical protein